MNAIVNYIKCNAHLSFLYKVCFLFILVFSLDFTIGYFLDYYYFKQESGFLNRTTFSIEKTNSDLLVFGASTANHHYRPDVFEDRLKLSYYNAGRDGNSIFYHYAILKAILKRFSPKMVILDIGRGEFWKFQTSYDRISSLLPYYENHPEIRSIVELKSPYERLKLISKIYPYNSLILSIAVGNAEFNKDRWKEVKGYVPLTRVWRESIKTDSSYTKHSLDSVKIRIYESFIKDCITSKVKLFVVCSPYYMKSVYKDSSLIVGQEIAKKYNIGFYDYSNDTVFINNPQYFEDIFHLNDEGAKLFSNLLVDRLKDTYDHQLILKK
jgi:hypothetical protein